MIKLNDVTITKEQISKNGKMILIEVTENSVYDNGVKTDKVDGFKYTIVLTANKFEKITVKVPIEKAAITQEEIDNSTDEIIVDFNNFIGKFYQSANIIGFSASADKCLILNKKVGVVSDK